MAELTQRKESRASLTKPIDKDFALDDYLFFNINRVSSLYSGLMEEAFKALDIDQTAWRVLTLLSHDEDSRVSEIARRGMIKIPTLSRRLERMVADGLVLREFGTDDRRTVRVSLTAKGREELRRAQIASTQIFEAATTGIPEEDVAQAIDVLQRMRRNLRSRSSG